MTISRIIKVKAISNFRDYEGQCRAVYRREKRISRSKGHIVKIISKRWDRCAEIEGCDHHLFAFLIIGSEQQDLDYILPSLAVPQEKTASPAGSFISQNIL